ncbi:MAG TPA: alpha/beta hydrolase [Alphaproteobacteria bacterium]|nr:alpha/beta hydrolase [Alphaproteobacteria bacterium]MDP6270369.1 alpha/beta hydrolase [Alphaproteobacteria bacterium]MDP7164796.1 alpha/beta hydrolase [Alphaproteobacteria bacterium]MDP7429293.1 alpha/beta hydrolase [Alphaproteobacteria bacterium]HJM49233.1 alpha/beta hydrolase [Alphaproteobacteria bacterium]
MDDEFEHRQVGLSNVTLHTVACGAGDPLVLLHGWPQTWFEWRLVMPTLGRKYRVVAPDMRGLGDSSRPAAGYDKKTVAGDIAELIARLELGPVHLVGHDWGGPVAFALAMAAPDLVRSLTIVDVAIPGIGSHFSQGGWRWHHQFHLTPELPEILISGREGEYYGWFYRNFGARPEAVDDQAQAEYLRNYATPEGLRAGLAYYRAIPQDIENNQALAAAGRLAMPVLTLSGATGRGRGPEVGDCLRSVADDVTEHVLAECGHWVPEEKPEEFCARLLEFLAALR